MLLLFSKKNSNVKTNVRSNQTDNSPISKESTINIDNQSSITKEEIEDNSDNKKIRINNTFCDANKELKQEFVKEYSKINEYISSKEYNSISNLLLKATPEVVSTKNVLFTFKNTFEVVLFEKNIEGIQKFLKMLYNKKYDVVAVDGKEWENLKKEYIKNIKSGKKYEYIEEKPIKKKTKSTTLQKSVEDIFGSDYTAI